MHSLAPSSISAYQSALNHYHAFCSQHGISTPFPLSEAVLMRFIAFLSLSYLSYTSMRVYLSGLRFVHILLGYPDPALSPSSRLEYVLRGVRRSSAITHRPRHLPITPRVLRLLFHVWSQPPVTRGKVMLWAACCTGFFGFLCSGEFTCPSLEAYVPSMLSVGDVAVDSYSDPSFITLHLRHSKTDVFGVGSTVYLARVDGPICPVKALLPYLVLRGPTPGPLFLFQDGSPLSRPRLVSAVRSVLESQDLYVRHFNGHSFRIGAATTAVEVTGIYCLHTYTKGHSTVRVIKATV